MYNQVCNPRCFPVVVCGCAIGQDGRVAGFDDIGDSRGSFPAVSSVRCNIPAAELSAWGRSGCPPALHIRLPVGLHPRHTGAGPGIRGLPCGPGHIWYDARQTIGRA